MSIKTEQRIYKNVVSEINALSSVIKYNLNQKDPTYLYSKKFEDNMRILVRLGNFCEKKTNGLKKFLNKM